MESLETYRGLTGGPFRTIIAGVDEHQGGRDATALAKQLLAADGSLMLARVNISDSVIGCGSSLAIEFAEFPHGRSQRNGGHHEGEGDDPLRSIDSPSVGRGLHELACADGADLIVIGSCRRGLVGRVMVDDEIRDALNGAPCAIAIAPFGYAERPAALGEIGVGYDGSPESKDGLAVARALAVEHGARLSAFQAVSVPSHVSAIANGNGNGNLTESAPAMVQQARARITALGGIEPHAAYGVPSEELALYSASLDLLVVGSRGYGPVGRLVHGSTSRQLARTARCPLLVLTRDARARLPADFHYNGRVSTTAAVG
jgi:nucleotide-binding universal stress UspA family protein